MIGLATCAAAFGLLGHGIPSIASDPNLIWWVFLERTKTTLTVPKPEVEKMQDGHIANFKRLFKINKLFCAGPMQDVPGGNKRGIVILKVGNVGEVNFSFRPDPYVQAKVFDVHAIPMTISYGRFETVKIDPEGIEENRMVVFTSPFRLSKETSQTHWDYVRQTGTSGHLSFAAATVNTDNIYGVALFRGKDEAAIQAWLDADPIIKGGVIKASIYPQWLAKGTLPKS